MLLCSQFSLSPYLRPKPNAKLISKIIQGIVVLYEAEVKIWRSGGIDHGFSGKGSNPLSHCHKGCNFREFEAFPGFVIAPRAC